MVLLAREHIVNSHTLDIHGIGLWWRNGSCTTGPTLSSYGRTWVASIPETDADFRRSLGKIDARTVLQRTDSDAIDRPNQSGRRPVERVGVELCSWTMHLHILGNAIVRYAFAIVICLDLAVI
jgi:hypothetical protein